MVWPFASQEHRWYTYIVFAVVLPLLRSKFNKSSCYGLKVQLIPTCILTNYRDHKLLLALKFMYILLK